MSNRTPRELRRWNALLNQARSLFRDSGVRLLNHYGFIDDEWTGPLYDGDAKFTMIDGKVWIVRTKPISSYYATPDPAVVALINEIHPGCHLNSPV